VSTKHGHMFLCMLYNQSSSCSDLNNARIVTDAHNYHIYCSVKQPWI
jgi:hypothetical protein